MEKLAFQITIPARAHKVFDVMLGKETYRLWTSVFDPTCDFEGGWNTGDKIRFTAIHDGKKGGMVAMIEQNIPGKYLSIRHLGLLDGDNEITSGPAVEGWAGAHENYSFEESDGFTTVTVEVDTVEDHVDYFNQTWPVALQKLKEICTGI